MAERVQTQIEKIRQDHRSGAAVLAGKAAEVLSRLAEESETETAQAFRNDVLEAGQALIRAQPSMAPILNLVNEVFLALEEVEGTKATREAVRRRAVAFDDALAGRGRRIAQHTLPLIHDGQVLMTHSFSSTVLTALQRAHAAAKHFHVICTESRPLKEGVRLAERLAREGIEVDLVVDAAAPHFVDGVGTIVVGADTLSPEGLVNKVGTYPLALAAREAQVPLYALCGGEKLLPAGLLSHFDIEEKDPSEVLAEPPANVTVTNVYFDVTPLRLLTGVVTEEGVMSIPEIERALKEILVHPTLQEAGSLPRRS